MPEEDNTDVSILIALIGGLLSAIPFWVICCCCRPSRHTVGISSLVWFSVTVIIGGLWHTLGKTTSRSSWTDADDGEVKSFTPWTATWKTSPNTLLIVPKDEQDLQNVVLNATRLPLRVVGSGHSWSSTAYTDGTIIDIRRLNAPVSLDFFNKIHNSSDIEYARQPKSALPNIPIATVTVQAGMKVQDAVQYLTSRGLCLYGTGSIRGQTIGGVVSHGVHGAHPDGLNRHVVGLKVLYANGTFSQITSENDLYMWRASMGMLGVIVRVTFEVFPLIHLSLERSPVTSFDELDQVATHLNSETSTTYTAFLYPSKCSQNIGYKRIGSYIGTDPTGELKNQTEFAPRLQLYFNDHMHPAMQYMFSPFGTVVSCLEQILANTGSSTLLSGPTEDILPNDGLIPKFFEIIDYEYMIPIPHCATFARELIQENRFGKILIPVCLRLLRAEFSCISMAAVDSCAFGLESMRGMTHTLDFKAIEVRVAELGGRAHLGKVAASTFKTYDFPCLPRFSTYRHERDPQNRFLTPFLAELIREQNNNDNNEYKPAVTERIKSQQNSNAFAWISWILLLLAILGVCYHTSPPSSNQPTYMSLQQQQTPKIFYTTGTVQDYILVFTSTPDLTV